jgi:hypothetical protein
MLKPNTDTAVAGGKGDEDARIVSGTEHQVRGDRALTHQAVGVETLIDLIVESRCTGLACVCGHGREQPCIDDQRDGSPRHGLS